MTNRKKLIIGAIYIVCNTESFWSVCLEESISNAIGVSKNLSIYLFLFIYIYLPVYLSTYIVV